MDKVGVFTPSQVAKHNSKNDIWLTINGRAGLLIGGCISRSDKITITGGSNQNQNTVMDVTKFLETHPGGEEVLMEYGGKDASKGFEAIGHTKEAYNMLSKFQVGYLQGYNINHLSDHPQEELPKGREMEAYVLKDDPIPKNSMLVEFAAPVLAAGIYFGYRCMTGAVGFGS